MKNGKINILFIPRSKVTSGINVMYDNTVCDNSPCKGDPYRTRLIIGGDKLPYPSESGYTNSALLEAKIIFSSIISNPGS